MKRQTRKNLLIAVAALALIILAAGLIMLLQKDAFGDNYFTRNKAVATVNGAKITKNEFAIAVNNYYSNIEMYNMYASFGYGKAYDTTTEAGMQSLKNDILNNLIDAEINVQVAKELGITLTDEEKAEVAQSAQDTLTNLKEQILSSAQSSGSPDPETYAVSMLANYFSKMGISQKTFVARNEHSALASKYAEKLEEHFIAERNVSDAELKDIYDEYATLVFKDSYQDGAYSQYSASMEIPYLYIPEDFIFVQVIQISDAEKAQEIMTKIRGGEDFETFRTSEDNESAEGKALAADKGQPIGENDSIFNSAVYVLAKDMQVGDVDMVEAVDQDSDGSATASYYIVKRVEGTTGIVPYEEVKSVIDGTLKSYAGSKYFDEQMDAWREKVNIVIDDEAVQAFDPAA